jgi:hypothetical protein
MVKDAQVSVLRQKIMEKKTQETAAAVADMSVRSARKWQAGPMPSESKPTRDWRTRPDAFAATWDSEIVPLLKSDERGVLESKTLLEEMERRHPGDYEVSLLRTLQRRVRDWRALHGPTQEVFFEQEHVAGREAAIDFTHCTELGVTIAGQPFAHLLFEFVLSFSKWRWVQVAFGETFEALVAGVQGALWSLGGVTSVLRSDNLSAATHELAGGGRALTKRFKAVLDHYGLKSTRIFPGKSNENGVVEKANDLTKRAVAQALVLRGSSDFPTVAIYEAFAREVLERVHNRHCANALAEEKQHLRPLPSHAVPSYTTYDSQVRKWSTIRISSRTYSVPSRLIGHTVEVRQHAEVVEVYYQGQLTERMPRLRGADDHRIDYRHVIWSLVRKPGAFARYRFREDLFPTLTFRFAYDALKSTRGERADVEYVRILHLAASTMESAVERALETLLNSGTPFDYARVKALAAPETPRIPEIHIGAPDLSAYDGLLACGGVL